MSNYIAILVMTLMGSLASIYLKKASYSKSFVEVLKNANLYIGAFLYLGAAIINIIVLISIKYSVVLPLTSVTYLWTILLSSFFLKEKVTGKKLIGAMCIVLGSVFVVL